MFLMRPSRHSSLSRLLGTSLRPESSLLASCSYSSMRMAAVVAALLVLQPITPHWPRVNKGVNCQPNFAVILTMCGEVPCAYEHIHMHETHYLLRHYHKASQFLMSSQGGRAL